MTEMNQHTPGTKKAARNEPDATPKNRTRGNANLRPLNTRTKGEQREIARQGGQASGQARRERRALRELLAIALEMPDDATGSTNAEAICAALIAKAKGGDVRAYEAVCAMVGQEPRQTVTFPLPPVETTADLPKATAALLAAVARGVITPQEGNVIASIVAAHSKAVDVAEFDARITALEEARQEGRP